MSTFRYRSASRVCAAWVLLAALFCPHLGAQTAPHETSAVNQDSLVITDFENRVKEYVKLHKKAQSGITALKKPTDSTSKINEYRRDLARNIRAARPQAKQGDIFTPAVTQEFKRLLSIAYQGTNGAQIRVSLRHDEPVSGVPVRVNAAYPERVPLQSTPPSILLNLPDLPPELDYRIVGRALVLRDVGASVIVDYIPDAIPAS